ncbi:hypothetical protein [Clavibacter michiganensis]|uniref:hypothetical protein n=1 Tax=Clavibacter michiganensis TaxID=28447 RepID=UPI001FF1DEE3|nr:hypothetical protein [Clavibacter michiganensis]MDO4045899.1 hypothetical protein [Clavibacter michiganensis]MDO4054765.1 hypothetical protein [Clavibacter michiganensis]MDO4058119.1 hypothetical protein [Clavibacter michiganensis]UOW05325.1 hypothetical protein MU580_15880 [Clavibacter michiganensis subsp. michiganensis]
MDYFVTVDAIDEIEAETARQIAEIRARADAETSTARSEATGVMTRMLAEGITRSEVAKRLGVAVRDVAKAPTETGGTAGVSDGQPTDDELTGEAAEQVAEAAFAQ